MSEMHVDMTEVISIVKRDLMKQQCHLSKVPQILTLWSVVDGFGNPHLACIELFESPEQYTRGVFFVINIVTGHRTYYGRLDDMTSALMTIAQCDYDTLRKSTAIDNVDVLIHIFERW